MTAPRALLVCGTDTGVGKTEVGRALLALWAALGLEPRALKLLETGCAPDTPEDALALRAACGPPHDSLPLDQVCPQRFLLPAAPLVAAEAEGREVDLHALLALVAQAQTAKTLLIETAGGLLVPLMRKHGGLVTNLDLAARLRLPVLLVGRAGLGTINHCALSAAALRARGVEVVAIVLNRTQVADDPALATNARVIAELTGVQVIGPTPFESDAALRPAALASTLAPLLHTQAALR